MTNLNIGFLRLVSRLASAGLLLIMLVNLGFAQTVSEWDPIGGGTYMDASNWSPQNIPGDVCCDESALFDTPGTRSIELAAGANLTLDNITSTGGDQSLIVPAVSAPAAAISVDGTLSIDRSSLTFGSSSGSPVNLQVSGEVQLIDGAQLLIEAGSDLTATSTTIATGKFEHTELQFLPNSTGHLGNTSLGNNPPIDSPINGQETDAIISMQNNTHLRTGDFQVGTAEVPNRVSVVELFGGILEQDAEAVVTVGNSAGIGTAVMAITSNAVAQYGNLIEINASGRVLNSGGHAEFGGDLTIVGSSIGYRELLDASREFASDTTISVSAGGAAKFSGASVELVGEQTLAILDTSSTVDVDTNLVLSNDSTIQLTYETATVAEPMLTVSGVADLNGTLEVSLTVAAGTLVSGQTLPLITATGGFSGAFDSFIGPNQPGTSWQWETVGDTLLLRAIESAAADYNGDGTVDAADYTLWRDTLGSTTMLAADGDGNGTVDAADYQIWRSNFGSTSGSPLTVPEPAATCLLAAWVVMLCRRNRQCQPG